MPSARSARIVYLDEARPPAEPRLPGLPTAPRSGQSRIALWLVVSLALHALVLALPAPPRAAPEALPAMHTLDVVIVAERAPPAVAPVARPDPAAAPAAVQKREPRKSEGLSPALRPKPAPRPSPLPAPDAEARPTLPAAEAQPLPEAAAPPAGAPPAPPGAPVAAAAPPSATAVPAVTPPSAGAAYLDNPAPAYPVSARRRGQSGLVVLQVKVSEAGKVLDVRVTQSAGAEALDRAALDAVRGWTFVPARRGDVPVAATVEVPIRFRLADVR